VTRWERWALNGTALTVALSGFVYLWMKYGMHTDDPFAVVNHPWQSVMLILHLMASPAFLLIFGVVFNSHVMRKLRVTSERNRRSGLLSLGTFATMVVTGYGLQVVTDEWWLGVLVAGHVAAGSIFTVSYAVHLVVSIRLARRRPVVAARGAA
jgi:hypothetical protein